MNKMRTPWKRILLVCVVAVCAMLLWCAGAFADIHLGPWGDVTYKVDEDDGILYITGSGTMKNFSQGDTYAWHACADKITRVEISSGVKNISEAAFYAVKTLRPL